MKLRYKVLAGTVALFALGTVPAAADHGTPPERPVIGMEIRAFDYPRAALDVCNGYVPTEPASLRFEGVALTAGIAEGYDPEGASEHWTADVSLSKAGFGQVFDSRWNHQNQGPHARSRKMETVQANGYGLAAGSYTVRVQIVGDASGNQFSAECDFTVAPAEPGTEDPVRTR